jgi:hypothetical protein
MNRDHSAFYFAQSLTVLSLAFGCSTPVRNSRVPASEAVKGIAQVDYAYAPEFPLMPYYANNSKKVEGARPDDEAQAYMITKPDSRNPHNSDHFQRVFMNGHDTGECSIGSAVKDFKVVTNPADKYAALFVQGGLIYGVYKSKPYPYQYTPGCSAGPAEIDLVDTYVVQDSSGKYQYWTYLPAAGENPESSLSSFMITANPTPNLVVNSGNGQHGVIGSTDELKLNPCFHIAGKPYQSYVAFFKRMDDNKIAWIDPADPQSAYKNKTDKAYPNVLAFLREMNISLDGKTCQ